MRVLSAVLVTSVLAFSGNSYAEELRPIEAKSIHLNDVRGVAYYTVRPNGYQIVATLTSSEAATPVRFTASLNPGQTVSISIAGEPGSSTDQVDFSRVGDQVIVSSRKQVASAN